MRGWWLAVLALLHAVPAAALDGGRYGEVRVIEPTGPMRGYVVLFSDRGGWTDADQAALEAIAGDGALAVGVNTDAYLDRLERSGARCDQLVGDAEGLSRQLQHVHGDAQYQFPILAGIGAGATLAWVTLAQAPVNTLAGAVSLDPSAALAGRQPLCGPKATEAAGAGFVYGAVHDLKGFWSAGFTGSAPADGRAHLEALSREGAPVEIEPVADDPALALPALVRPHLRQAAGGGIAALPLIELPAERPSRLLAVVLSGDGGWRDLDKTIAEDLQRDGVDVVGWDCVRYFWHRRTPEQAAADLQAVLEAYTARWHADRVALIGYSFGADVLPILYHRLPAALRQRVVLMSLLGYEGKADWEISVSGWLGAPPTEDATPVGPALAALPAGLVQCFYGAKEGDSACPEMTADRGEVIRTEGGHHFDGNYGALEQRILAAFRKRAERPAPVVR